MRPSLKSICDEFETYGYRRVDAELRHRGLVVNAKKVRRASMRSTPRSAISAPRNMRIATPTELSEPPPENCPLLGARSKEPHSRSYPLRISCAVANCLLRSPHNGARSTCRASLVHNRLPLTRAAPGEVCRQAEAPQARFRAFVDTVLT
jgi:HTH-like domain